MKPLHAINFPRCLFLDTHVGVAGKRLLDLGCGGGLFAEAMAERGARVTGLDPSTELIKVAQEHAREKNLRIDYQAGDAAWLLQKRGHRESYDLVSCLEVLEHTERPAELIGECAAFLRKGGWGYFSTINRTARAYALVILAAERLLRWLPRGTHSYSRFIRPAELSDWLEANGLRIRFMSGLAYDLLGNKFELAPSVAANYLMLAQKR